MGSMCRKPYLGGEGLDRLQVEVIVQMQVVEVLAVNEQIEHVVTLSADLQADLHPVQLGGLEKLCCFERAEQIPKTQRRQKVYTKH